MNPEKGCKLAQDILLWLKTIFFLRAIAVGTGLKENKQQSFSAMTPTNHNKDQYDTIALRIQ